MCGEHQIPRDGLLHERHGIKCRDLFFESKGVQESSSACDTIQLAAFQTGCCNQQYVPETSCSVCPDGSAFHTSISIPGGVSRRALTCADISSEASFLDFFNAPGDCDDTFLRRSAAWCQCPGKEVECHLCPRGAAPINLEKTENVLYGGWSCETFQYILALLSHGECSVAPQVLAFDAAAFCCEGVEPPNVCDFCPSGQQVLDPEKIIESPYGAVRCGDVHETLQMVPTEESCDLLLRSFSAELCCGRPGESAATQGSSMFPYYFGIILYGYFWM